MRIRPATPQDAEAIAAIYAPYVTDRAVSFETEAPSPQEMRERIERGGDQFPWFVADDLDGAILGYAYAGPFRTRFAYRFAVETSVYVADDAQGRGAGRSLYERLLSTLQSQGFAQAVAVIAVPNQTSVAFHERFGFVHGGTHRRVGYKLGEWHDVGFWQRELAQVAHPPGEPKRLSELAG